jgi:hypothetical protein
MIAKKMKHFSGLEKPAKVVVILYINSASFQWSFGRGGAVEREGNLSKKRKMYFSTTIVQRRGKGAFFLWDARPRATHPQKKIVSLPIFFRKNGDLYIPHPQTDKAARHGVPLRAQSERYIE